MKQRKRILACMMSILMISGCTGYDKDAVVNRQVYHITSNGKTAFASGYTWDVSENPVEIVIPETAEGAVVKKLGGFFGTGVPSPFCITGETGYTYSAYDPFAEKYGAPMRIQQVPFTIHLPKTLEKIDHVANSGWLGSRNENGELVFLRPIVRFEIDPDNKTFYANDGLVYQYEDNSLVDLSALTSPELPKMTLAQKLRGRYVKTNEQDQEVWEFFDSMDQIFVHINSYMEGEEYMYTALEYMPVDVSLLNSTEADSIDVSAKQFSSFAMAGQYTETDSPYYRLTAKENAITILALDENREPIMDSGFEMEKDLAAPSQFPLNEERFESLKTEEEQAYADLHSYYNKLTEKVLECEEYRIEFFLDGTVTMIMNRKDAPLIYHGIAKMIPPNEMYGDTDLLFCMRAVGGTTEPILCRVTLHKEEDGSFRFSTSNDYPGTPLIPVGQETIVVQ